MPHQQVCPAPCSPSVACREDVRTWSLANGPGFLPRHLGLKMLTTKLPLLLHQCAPGQRHAVIDVGAGVHGLGPPWDMHATGLHDDDSDALWLLAGFNGEADVHAFEANGEKAKHLVAAAHSRKYTANLTQHLTVHEMGVGANVTTARIATCGPSNIWSVAGASGAGSSCNRRSRESVHVTTLDVFASSLSLPIFYLKVDVEGGEWDVLHGMRHLLRRGAVQLASFEYAVNWHPLFNKRSPLTPHEAAEAHSRSLSLFQETLSHFGYDTYLINSGRAGGVVLVPVHGDFWHEDLEICYNRSRYYSWGQWCWNDLLAVRRCNDCVRRTLLGVAGALAETKSRQAKWTFQTQEAFFAREPRSAADRHGPAAPMRYADQLRTAFPSCDCL